jgi:hypothetical protein
MLWRRYPSGATASCFESVASLQRDFWDAPIGIDGPQARKYAATP